MDIVMPCTVPLKVGLYLLSCPSIIPSSILRAYCVACEIGLLTSAVLSTLQRPTMDLVMPCTVPLRFGLANGAFELSATCVAFEIGLFESDDLSTLPSPTIDLVIPLTVPLKVGLAALAFALIILSSIL